MANPKSNEARLARRADAQEIHLFEPQDLRAIDCAIAAERPLLLRGEPGVGKTQLAEAYAAREGLKLVSFVVDARTEVRDLRWTEDLVGRLAEAQIGRAVGASPETVRRELDMARFITAGPLWWGFDPEYAEDPTIGIDGGRDGTDSAETRRMVVLIDEIDKADSDLPNGLLEALGAGGFDPGYGLSRVEAKSWPLVIITTNEERPLPDAFLRRCIVHDMYLGRGDTLRHRLMMRARANFPKLSVGVIDAAINQLVQDRGDAEHLELKPLPGQAEFMDLLRAIMNMRRTAKAQRALIEDISHMFLRKHPDLKKDRGSDA